MKKKGFTLVELLAVIVIISLLSLITINAVSSIVNGGKAKLNEKQISFLQKSAQLWGLDNMDILPSADITCEYITLGNLKRDGYVSDDAVNLNNMSKISDDLMIVIRPNITDNTLTYKYEIDTTNSNNCEYLYERLKYTVAFNTMGGTEIASVMVERGGTIQQPKNPQKHEYKFREWTLDNETYDFDTPVTGDITLTATYDTTDLYTLKTGQEVNKSIKTLVKGSVASYSTFDYTVEHIEFYSNGELPEGFTLSQLQSLPSTVVSETDETIKAYYDSTSKTVYLYSSGEIVWNNNSEYIFAYFTKLKVFEIPYNVTSIEEKAFQSCTDLASITIPNSVTSIEDSAFQSCSKLASITIPNSVTSIGDYAFNDCTSLTSITIPSSVTSIGDGAFAYCTNLASIVVDSSNQIYEDRNSNAIIKKSNNELAVGCKNTTIPNSVTSIGNHAFYGCSGLTSITIPSSVTSINRYAFQSCSGLTSITIPNSVTSIGAFAFNSCSNLTSITIPSSVTSIEAYAFQSCYKLTSISFNLPTGWWYANSPFATSGTSIDLSDASQNATYFVTTYKTNYWKNGS